MSTGPFLVLRSYNTLRSDDWSFKGKEDHDVFVGAKHIMSRERRMCFILNENESDCYVKAPNIFVLHVLREFLEQQRLLWIYHIPFYKFSNTEFIKRYNTINYLYLHKCFDLQIAIEMFINKQIVVVFNSLPRHSFMDGIWCLVTEYFLFHLCNTFHLKNVKKNFPNIFTLELTFWRTSSFYVDLVEISIILMLRWWRKREGFFSRF